MNNKKNILTDLKFKFQRSAFKKKLNKILEFIAKKVKTDIKRVKFVIIILFFLFISFIDILWLVIPYHPKAPQKAPPAYTMEEIPSLVNKYQLILSKNPKDFKAHYELGKIYLFINETEKSKVELFQAISVAPEGNFQANFILTDVYLKEKNPAMADKMISLAVDDDLSVKDFERKADLLFTISKLYFSQNNVVNAYETLNEASNDYDKLTNKPKQESAKKEMLNLLVDMADNAYYNEKNPTKAMIYLDNSQKIEENAAAYARLGYLFFENPKLSAEYFEKAYSFNPLSVNLEVFTPMLCAAIDISKAEGREGDTTYYKGILERVREENLTSRVHSKIFLNSIEGFFEKQDNKDEYLPVTYFDIYNGLEKKSINYLKIRAVFVDTDYKIIGHRDAIIVNSSNPLLPQCFRKNIRMESNRYLTNKDLQSNVYKVLLYISTKRPDEWAYSNLKMLK